MFRQVGNIQSNMYKPRKVFDQTYLGHLPDLDGLSNGSLKLRFEPIFAPFVFFEPLGCI